MLVTQSLQESALFSGLTDDQVETIATLGQEAVYNVAQEIVVLSGKPVLIDKTRGKVEGHKLTFHLADDRIIVENRDGERSEAVIK